MGILRWKKLPEYSEADEQLVRLHLCGKYPAACIKQKVIGDIYQKYDPESGEKLPKEKHEVFQSDRTCRLNWAALRRALVRLERSGYVTSFHLYYDGRLDIKFFDEHKEEPIKEIKPIVKHTEILAVSCVKTVTADDTGVDSLQLHKDIRLSSSSGPIPMVKRERKYSELSKDYVPGMPEFARNEMYDHINLHSVISQIQRAKDFFEAKPSFGDKWPARFKFNPDYYSGAIVRRTIAEQQIDRGYCVWPSPQYKPIGA